jgi:Uma2 family endonuclease
MTLARQPIKQTDPPRSPLETLPTMYDLPSEEVGDSGLPDEYHVWQGELLTQAFRPPMYPVDQVFAATDLNLYYDPKHTNWYKRPDWYGVVGVDRLYQKTELRLSYVIWQEGVDPTVVVELLSPSTESEDLGQTSRESHQPPSKWDVYERILRVPYYIVFNRYTDELSVFQNLAGHYEEITVTESRVWLPELQLGLGLWQGPYRNAERLWLRWYDKNDVWILTEQEQTQQAKQQASEAEQRVNQAEQRADQAEQRAEALAQRLRELGLEP